MQQVVNYDNFSDTGYFSSKPMRVEKHNKEESHLIKQTPLTVLRTDLHHLNSDIFTYFPKAFAGSKNSDFHEFLSLGMVPYLVGTATMIACYGFGKGKANANSAKFIGQAMTSTAAGAVLYGLCKRFSKRITRALINASTNVNLDERYIKKVDEIPENGRSGVVRWQYPEVYGSVEFPRIDLKEADGDLNHNDKNYHSDKIAKKLGYKEKLASAGQLTDKKAREVKTRATALENILGYVPAALGVAIGSQKGFANLSLSKVFNFNPKLNLPFVNFKTLGSNITNIAIAFKDSCKQLWQGNSRNALTKNFGKALAVGTLASMLLTWLIPVIAFKKKDDTMKSKIDTKKEFEVQ